MHVLGKAGFGLAAISLWIAPLSASAQTVRVSGQINDGQSSKTAKSAEATSGTVTTTATDSDSYEAGSGSGSVRTTATLGELHTYAAATWQNIIFPNGTDQTVAQAIANWSDSLTVTSSVLALGSPCQIVFVTVQDGTLTVISPAQNSGLTNNTYAYFGSTFIVQGQRGSEQLQYHRNAVGASQHSSFKNDPPIILLSYVGDSIGMDATLDSTAVASPRYNETDMASSDYSDTAHYYASSLTPGITLVSASGHDYTPPAVPEPGALPLLGLGLGGFALAARRQA